MTSCMEYEIVIGVCGHEACLKAGKVMRFVTTCQNPVMPSSRFHMLRFFRPSVLAQSL